MALALALCTLRELPSLIGSPETGLCVGSGSTEPSLLLVH